MIGIRDERPEDAASIDAVTRSAFGTATHSSGTEQFVVRALRAAGRLSTSLVAVEDARIVGHIATSPVRIGDGTPGWHGLGPLSVAPRVQRQGIGTRLVTQALARLREAGAAGCVVLGDPGYYARFGFRAEPGLVLPGIAPGFFQAMAFDGPLPAGEVAYDAAFEADA